MNQPANQSSNRPFSVHSDQFTGQSWHQAHPNQPTTPSSLQPVDYWQLAAAADSSDPAGFRAAEFHPTRPVTTSASEEPGWTQDGWGQAGQSQATHAQAPSQANVVALRLPALEWWLTPFQRWYAGLMRFEEALFAGARWRQVALIVAQGNLTQKQVERLDVIMPATMRIGLLSLVGLVLWLTWPSSPLPVALSQSEAGRTANTVLASLALVNAAERAQPPAANAADAAAQPVLVPTAAPAPVDPTTVDPTGAPTAAPMVAAGSGRPQLMAEAVLLAPTPTAVNLVAPVVITASVPQVRVIPGVELKLPTSVASPTPTAAPPTPTPIPVNLAPGRLWSAFAPPAAPDNDHFWVGRPFGDYAPNQLASPNYQFGSTAGGRYRTHHGVDISNPFGVPVLAATDGEVVHAGLDDPALLGPYNNFYGNAVVIRLDRQLPVAGGQLDVFLLYGHLSQVNVTVGQHVKPEDVIGQVGMTGIAIGPHLHVEIRLGENTYYNNVNPYLWMMPPEGQGAIAVRVLTADGRTWPGAYISIVRYTGGIAGWARQIITYLDTENIGPDPAWGENGAMDGVPAGSYYVVGVVNGERLSAEVTVNAGQTTFVELRTQQ
ncbi:MAG: M23 family metallopeptidase [Caldilineaceae bacterium]